LSATNFPSQEYIPSITFDLSDRKTNWEALVLPWKGV
jgi:hypothetical protein